MAKQPNHKAIVLAHFGTTVPGALSALENVCNEVRESFPGIEVRISFTSNIIRRIWQKRRADPQTWLDQGVSKEVLYCRSLLGTIGLLQDEGYRSIIVQPTHIFHGEQYEDLRSVVNALGQIRTVKARWMPFAKIVAGRPALGTHGETRPYHEDIAEVAAALQADVELARQEEAALVYMGHGNETWSTGVFSELAATLRRRWPDVPVVMGMVEGWPGLEEVKEALAASGRRRVVLKPLMLSAGDHALNDMSGEDDDCWQKQLEKLGYSVQPVLQGLGSRREFAALYSRRIRQTARDHDIPLL